MNCTFFRHRHRHFGVLLLLLSLLLVSACSVEDERDECCERLTLHYRYVRQDLNDEFRTHIKHMQHFLFDAQGRYLRTLHNPKNLQKLHISQLPEGEYTVLTIANATKENTALSTLTPQITTLSDVQLALTHSLSPNTHGNGDELFWNTRKIKAVRHQNLSYICDLSNIHCHLRVRVKWETIPKQSGSYTMRLREVPGSYSLSPIATDSLVITKDNSHSKKEYNRVIHTFPTTVDRFYIHELNVPLYNLELESEFITLRYRNKYIPILQIFFGEQAITKPLDLSRAFQIWGWYPDSHAEQIYKIDITIRDDGRVVLNQWAETTVMDWIDGGNFGS